MLRQPLSRVAMGALLLAAVVARVPFLGSPLCDEEGAVATAVRHIVRGERPRFTLARQVDGREVLALPEHNLGGYLLPGVLFAPVYHAVHAEHDLERRVASVRWLRCVYLLIYAAALLLALLLLAPERRLLGSAMLLAFALFPLPLLASIQVQYDGAVMTLLLVASCLLMTTGATRSRWPLVAVGGFVLSLGKLEFLCAGIGTAGLAALTLRNWRIAVYYAGGALAGLALCAAIDWENFNAAYFVIGKFARYQSGSGLKPWARIQVFFDRFTRDLWPVFAALACAAASALLVIRQWPRVVFVLAPATAVVVAYCLFAWPGDGFPRYFAPAFVLLPIALAQLWKPAWWSYAAAGAFLIASGIGYAGELHWGGGALCRRVGVQYDSVAGARKIEAHPRDCMQISTWETGYYTVHAPYACWAIDAYEPQLRAGACR